LQHDPPPGSLGYSFSQGSNYNAWSVHSGDVSPIPLPGVWPSCSGLLGLIGIAKEKAV
jgi:hypothetical protein